MSCIGRPGVFELIEPRSCTLAFRKTVSDQKDYRLRAAEVAQLHETVRIGRKIVLILQMNCWRIELCYVVRLRVYERMRLIDEATPFQISKIPSLRIEHQSSVPLVRSPECPAGNTFQRQQAKKRNDETERQSASERRFRRCGRCFAAHLQN